MLDDINERMNKISLQQFSQSKIRPKFHNLQLIKLAAFQNNQLNAIFNDNTTIILHPGFEFLTYFHSNNKKIRIKTENLIKNHNIHLKLHLMLNIFNLFSNTEIFPCSGIFLKLYTQTIKLSGEESELIFISKDKIEKAYWIYEDYFFEQDLQSSGYFLIKSVDESIKFYLFKNLRIIKIEYPYLIQTLEGNFLYIKTVKFFSTQSLPSNWQIPLQLLIKYFNVTLLNLNLNNSLDEFLNEEISSEFTIRKSKEYFNFLTSNSSQRINQVNEMNQADSSFIKLADDEINPIAFIFNSESKLDFLYTRNSTYLMIQDSNGPDECEIINNESPQLISFTSNSISILFYQHDLADQTVYSVEIEKYLQLLIEYSNEKNIQDTKFQPDFVNEMIYELSEIKKNMGNQIKFKFKGIGNNSKEIKTFNNESISYRKMNNLSFNFDGDELLHFKIIKDLGEFFAFKNKALKVKFSDRTILKIDSRKEFCWAINKFGQASIFNFDDLNGMGTDFTFYFEHSMKFYNYCFQSSSEKRIINEKLKLYDEMSESSLKKINAMKIICENEFNKSNIKNNKKIINNYDNENVSYHTLDKDFSNQVSIEE